MAKRDPLNAASASEMEEDDDAWSYSFPPSSESLPLTGKETTAGQLQSKRRNGNDADAATRNGDIGSGVGIADSARGAEAAVVTTSTETAERGRRNGAATDSGRGTSTETGSGASAEPGKNHSDSNSVNVGAATTSISDTGSGAQDKEDDTHSQVSISSSNNGVIRERLNVNTSLSHISRSSSHSSASLQSPFLVKSIPANPLTTRQDANSTISVEGYSNALEESLLHTQSTSLSNRNSFFNTMKVYSAQEELQDDRSRPLSSPSSAASPKIIAYRKSKRSASEGVDFTSLTPASSAFTSANSPPAPKYDTSLYIDEMFKDTPYRFTIMKRNTDFHQLFRSVDLTDRLLDDFSCALSREILLQGRIYISETYICFNSSLLGWVTNIILKMSDIVRFEKKFTAGLFPNGILIETKDAKYTFASLISRDATYDFMKTVWEKSGGVDTSEMLEETKTKDIVAPELNSPMHSPEIPQLKSPTQISHKRNQPSVTDTPKIQKYIMSLDGDDDAEEDESDRSDESDAEETVRILKFKEGSKYRNSGPETHTATMDTMEKLTTEPNEIELCKEIIDAPMGIVYEIMFSSDNTSFHQRFIESQNGSELSEYEEFHPVEEDPSSFERKISYRRALGYSIGPKSTKCELSEVIEHLNFADYVSVVTTTTTPDVPSGNVFSVKTKYVFTWAEDNKTQLVISYYIKWTGKSWIKAIIEKQSLAGQKSATEEIVKLLREEIAATTYYTSGPLVAKVDALSVPEVKEEKTKLEVPRVEPTPVVTETFSANDFMRHNIVTVCYLILSFLVLLLILQLRMFRVIKETNELAKNQSLINAHLIRSLISTDSAPASDRNELRQWAQEKYGKDLSSFEQVEFLLSQLNKIYIAQDTEIGDVEHVKQIISKLV